MRIQEDKLTRYQFEIWFEYTRRAMNEIKEGAMLAVRNFSTDATTTHYSILEVTGLKPIHYALGEDPSGFPGFVMEAARNASQDWIEQDDSSLEDTTVIRCTAIPTNLEIIEHEDGSLEFDDESNIPMIGEEAKLLATGVTEQVVNRDLDLKNEDLLLIGTLIRDQDVKVYLRFEELLQVHFGIFGFTGSGKSNLLSTLIYKLLTATSQPVKIVLFDLMGEYTTLLIDLLCQLPKARLIGLGDKTFPGSVVEYLADPENTDINKATRDMLNTTLLPKQLKSRQKNLKRPLQNLLNNGKIKIWREKNPTLGEFVAGIESDIIKGNMGHSRQTVIELVERLKKADVPITSKNVNFAVKLIEKAKTKVSTNTAISNLEKLKHQIVSEGEKMANLKPLPPRAMINIPAIIEELNDPDNSGLYIVQAHNPDELRHFAWMLGTFTYEERRLSGQIAPLVSFIFDEADEFIPQNAKDSYAESTDIAMTLARRGRKFGLGIGIATQRVTYLNTSILAQPHTYFVSKLPRKSDQERITDAFGIGEDMFRQTFKFKKGNWLLVSYDATGLEAIPLPIHVENANDRIANFLDDYK